jgi:hypothetical protein
MAGNEHWISRPARHVVGNSGVPAATQVAVRSIIANCRFTDWIRQPSSVRVYVKSALR